MKRLVIGLLAVCAISGLSGCASTGTAAGEESLSGPSRFAAGPTPQDPNPHGVAGLRGEGGEGGFSTGAMHEGIPTPEPAMPSGRAETFAGPTPQVPIPVHRGLPGSFRE